MLPIASPAEDRQRAPLIVKNIPLYCDNAIQEYPLSKSMTLNVRVSGALSDFVAANVDEAGAYENVSEYVRDLIRRDMQRAEAATHERLKAELNRAFSAPDSAYQALNAETVIARNASRKTR